VRRDRGAVAGKIRHAAELISGASEMISCVADLIPEAMESISRAAELISRTMELKFRATKFISDAIESNSEALGSIAGAWETDPEGRATFSGRLTRNASPEEIAGRAPGIVPRATATIAAGGLGSPISTKKESRPPSL
jgi:hypothetical protein